jgi:hypothetical protein
MVPGQRASHRIDAGTSPKDVQAHLGHEDVDTTPVDATRTTGLLIGQ